MDLVEELCTAVEGMTLEEVSAELAKSSRDIRDPEALAAFLLAGGAPEPAVV